MGMGSCRALGCRGWRSRIDAGPRCHVDTGQDAGDKSPQLNKHTLNNGVGTKTKLRENSQTSTKTKQKILNRCLLVSESPPSSILLPARLPGLHAENGRVSYHVSASVCPRRASQQLLFVLNGHPRMGCLRRGVPVLVVNAAVVVLPPNPRDRDLSGGGGGAGGPTRLGSHMRT